MVKSYLRYALEDSFGCMNSRGCRSILPLSHDLVLTGHNETVSVWNCRTSEPKVTMKARTDDTEVPSNVICFLYTFSKDRWVFVGYADGAIRRFQLRLPTSPRAKFIINEDYTLHGHQSGVSCMALSASGKLLASGSRDCSIIVWETSGDIGHFKLEGHRCEVTDIKFLHNRCTSESLQKSRKLAPGEFMITTEADLLGFLVSVSKDCIIRIWDLTSQVCLQTVIDATAELHCLAINAEETRLYVSGKENRIRCYKLDMTGSARDPKTHYEIPIYAKELPSLTYQNAYGRCSRICLMYATGKESSIMATPGQSAYLSTKVQHKAVLLCVTNQFVMFYRVYDHSETLKRKKRRNKRSLEKQKAHCSRLREALRAAGKTATAEFDDLDGEIRYLEHILSGFPEGEPLCPIEVPLPKHPDGYATDEVNYMFMINTLQRMATFQCFSKGFVVGHIDNSLSIWHVDVGKILSSKISEDEDMDRLANLCQRVLLLNNIGHPDAIMGLSVSHNDMMIMSYSSDVIKLWNSRTHNCIRTLGCEKITYAYFVAGNKHILLGTGKGELKVVYLDNCEIQEVFKVPSETSKNGSNYQVIGIAEHPNHSCFSAAFRDSQIRTFEYVLKKKGSQEILLVKELSATPVSDEPTDIKYSPDGKLLAVGLHNNTVQTFYTDTMKPFLTLYGHTLPVTSIDISSDGTLLASGSLDKSIKIWGLDFGNIHRSLLAHTNNVLNCRWVNGTHYLITTGADSIIKLWDCDTYEQICQLRAHSYAVRSIALSGDTHFFVTASEDTTIRFWRRSDEQLFISEEQEKELEIQLEHEAVRDDFSHAIPVDKEALANKATRKTMKSVKATEQLMQIIDEAEEYRLALEEHVKRVEEYLAMHSSSHALSRYGKPDASLPKEPEPPLELFNRTPTEHVMMAVTSLSHGVIHEVLIALPFIYAEKLLRYIVISLESYQERYRNYIFNLRSIEIPCKAALLLVQIYFKQFQAMQQQRSLITKLAQVLPWALQLEKERMLKNKAALEYVKSVLDVTDTIKRVRDS